MNQKSNWINMLKNKMKKNNDKGRFKSTLNKGKMKEEFLNDYGSCGDQEFTAWTENYVYFSEEYDGLSFVNSIPRNPNNQSKSISC